MFLKAFQGLVTEEKLSQIVCMTTSLQCPTPETVSKTCEGAKCGSETSIEGGGTAHVSRHLCGLTYGALYRP